MSAEVICGDCLEVMPTLDAESFDAIISDPPYGLGFMGKAWDHGVPGFAFWEQAYRVAKPGSYLLAFGGTRTFHRLTCAIEDAGWEIRDCLSWLYGSGFPKSLDVSKAIDRAAGAEREIVGSQVLTGTARRTVDGGSHGAARTNASDFKERVATVIDLTRPATPEARQWQGWGTALKPGWEPIIMARKPFKKTVAANVQEHGTGAINIDACRIDTTENLNGGAYAQTGTARADGWGMQRAGAGEYEQPSGRWPANVVLDEEAAGILDEQSGISQSKRNERGTVNLGQFGGTEGQQGNRLGRSTERGHDDLGGASRFFYTAKASRSERNAGLEGFEEVARTSYAGADSRVGKVRSDGATQHAANTRSRNHHPTVKPVELMRWLCRLVTPPQGIILDPFAGSGTTGVAATLEAFSFVGIEREEEYAAIARKRITETPPSLFGEVA